MQAVASELTIGGWGISLISLGQGSLRRDRSLSFS